MKMTMTQEDEAVADDGYRCVRYCSHRSWANRETQCEGKEAASVQKMFAEFEGTRAQTTTEAHVCAPWGKGYSN
jgi:hypothetical protein